MSICLMLGICFFAKVQVNEEIIYLRAFVKERANQYALPQGKKIYLYSSPRIGSILVYNVLRFLFEKITAMGRDVIEFSH